MAILRRLFRRRHRQYYAHCARLFPRPGEHPEDALKLSGFLHERHFGLLLSWFVGDIHWRYGRIMARFGSAGGSFGGIAGPAQETRSTGADLIGIGFSMAAFFFGRIAGSGQSQRAVGREPSIDSIRYPLHPATAHSPQYVARPPLCRIMPVVKLARCSTGSHQRRDFVRLSSAVPGNS